MPCILNEKNLFACARCARKWLLLHEIVGRQITTCTGFAYPAHGKLLKGRSPHNAVAETKKGNDLGGKRHRCSSRAAHHHLTKRTHIDAQRFVNQYNARNHTPIPRSCIFLLHYYYGQRFYKDCIHIDICTTCDFLRSLRKMLLYPPRAQHRCE